MKNASRSQNQLHYEELKIRIKQRIINQFSRIYKTIIMKNLKRILAFTVLLIGLESFAQTIVDGIYSTTFGNITMSTEVDKEFPNGSLIYGDYKGSGTISGYYADFRKEIKGTFFNGSSEGKFIFMMPFAIAANKPVESMNGFWGYSSDNKNSTSANDKWNITERTGNAINIKNVTNVWSGKWNTTDGDMHLVQVGNKITGRYKGIGTVSATYNPSTRLLTGTFSNEKIRKTGFIKFYFEGNTFKGEWGWTPSMTEGNWDGTKDLKNNKELSKKPTTTTSSSQNAIVDNQKNTTSDPDNTIKMTQQGLRSNAPASSTKTIKISLIKIVKGNNLIYRLEELYGFAGVQVFKVTNSGSVLIKSFGNKPDYFFNLTESNPLPGNLFGKYSFPNQPNYVREFQVSQADWNDPNVRFEVRLWHHIKGKIVGPNRDYNKYSETFDLNTMKLDRDGKIWVGNDYKNGINYDSILDIDFKDSRALFQVQVK